MVDELDNQIFLFVMVGLTSLFCIAGIMSVAP
jgi:hypothetical protein